MKRITLTFLAAGFILAAHAQALSANDSVNTQSGNSEMVFYNLVNGIKVSASNTNWQLAVSVQPTQFPNNTLQGASLRINEGNGVKVYEVPGFTADSFSVVLDTTGYHTWSQLHDADSLLDYGALNTGTNISSFFYGWGSYAGPPTHNVMGTKVFLFELPNGVMKKLLVEVLDKDTAWDIKYANIDNSDLQNAHISKVAIQGKQYVYLDMLTNTIRDKEPLAADWDLQFLKYAATDVMPGSAYPVLGVWANKGVTVARAAEADVTSDDYSNYTFSTSLNTIGWNWKIYDNQSGLYSIQDSLAFFVKTKSGYIYKLVFTGYESSTGVISFYKKLLASVSGIPNNKMYPVSLYPNPAQTTIYVSLPDGDEQGTFTLTNMAGQFIAKQTVNEKQTPIDISYAPKGMYVATVTSVSGTGSRILIIQ